MPAPDTAKVAEYNVIGAILLDSRTYYRVPELQPEDFQDPRNRKAYIGVREMLAEDKPIDVFTLCDHTGLDRDYIEGIYKTTATSANVRVYADVVKREARRRNIRLTLQKGLSNIEDQDPEAVATDCMAGLQQSAAKTKDVTLAKAITAAFEKSRETQRRIENGELAGISTTLSKLDELTGGLRGPRMIVVGGRPGTFKTAFAWQMVLAAALRGAPCGFVSLEMGADELGERAIANLLKVDGHQFSSGDVGAYQNAKRKCAGGIKDLPVWIDDATQD
jgi:replicative DNA helicase